jgi:Fe2+ or Zn2+ uptake regulation protein
MKTKQGDSKILLDKVNMKKTNARVALLDLLSATKKPLSTKAIALKLAPNDIDRVTVYRMLEACAEKGIIRKVETGSREAQYEIIDIYDDHHHVICLDCKKVSDFTGCESDKLIIKALKQVKDFKSISHHSFDLYGVCNSCARK